jgi:hypothetical protein
MDGKYPLDKISACKILVISKIFIAVIIPNITVNARQNRRANHEWKI